TNERTRSFTRSPDPPQGGPRETEEAEPQRQTPDRAAATLFQGVPGAAFRRREPRAAIPGAPPGPPTRRQARLLLVDDDPMVLDVLTVALEQAGYQVDTAPDGAAAQRFLEARSYDLALLDHRLPDMTGTEVAQIIETRWPSLPVVLLTGVGED